MPVLTPDRSIIDLVDHEFHSSFSGMSWLAWRVYLKALFGLPLDMDK